MARKPKRKATGRRVAHVQKPSRQKLDPRLALLLSLPDRRRRALKAEEDGRLAALGKDIAATKSTLAQGRKATASARGKGCALWLSRYSPRSRPACSFHPGMCARKHGRSS